MNFLLLLLTTFILSKHEFSNTISIEATFPKNEKQTEDKNQQIRNKETSNIIEDSKQILEEEIILILFENFSLYVF